MEKKQRRNGKAIEAREGPCYHPSLPNKPCFREIIFQGYAHLMQIPPDFLKKYGSELRRANKVTLVGPCGSQEVRLVCDVEDPDGNTYYFREGWGKFSKTHSLGNNEVLIFEYDEGRMSFDVSIFDNTGIMRTTNEVEILEKRRQFPQRNGEKKEVHGAKEIKIEVKIEKDDSNDGRVDKKTISTSKGKEQVQEHKGMNMSNNHPFFTICLNNSNVNKVFMLRIPKSFSKYFPDGKRGRATMVLKNEEGKQWSVTAVEGSIKNWAFSGGWKAFIRDNELKEGDTCTFELVHKNMVHVHIS